MKISLPGLMIEASWPRLRYWFAHLFRDELIYSNDGKLFYVGMSGKFMPRDWCSIEKGPDGKHTLYPFSFYSIRSGRREFVRKSNPLAKLYRSIYPTL